MRKFLKSHILKLTTFRLGVIISLFIFVLFFMKEENNWDFGIFDLMELKALDIKFLDRGRIPEHGDVVIAAIDEKSIERFGRWPWNRIIIAQLIKKLAEEGASVIAFDVVFSDPDRTNIPQVLTTVAETVNDIEMESCDDECEDMREAVLSFLKKEIEHSNPDKILAEIIEAAGNVVLGFFIFTDEMEVASLDQKRLEDGIECVSPSKIAIIKPWDPAEEKNYVLRLNYGLAIRSPLPVFCEATESFGHFSFHQDTDGSLRWTDLVEEVKSDDPEYRLIYPSLSLMAAARHLDKEIVVHTYPMGVDRISLGLGEEAHNIPTNFLGRMLVNYHGAEKIFPTYSIADILDGSISKERLKDKIILIGATAIGVYDLRVTPFQEDFPGVEIHANVIDNILNHNYLSRPDWAFYFELFIILLFGVMFGFVMQRIPAIYGATFIFVVVVGYYLVDKHFFFANGYWVRSVLPIMEAFLIFLTCYIYRYVTEEMEKKRTRAAFKQYLNESVVDTIMGDYEKLKLGGEKREITVLFSDIRDFTTISESLTPDELGNILAEYLNPMTQIVFDQTGVLDKYMGDAIMAFWGAPAPVKNHAEQACITALSMMEELNSLNQVWSQRGIPRMNIGIGVNTGQMWVGNMGSHVRFDYTVIGDAVNLGSRLEGTNKQYGTNIIISEFTHSQIKENFLCRRLDSIRVKGKHEPVTIYELISKGEGTEEQRSLSERFESGLNLYSNAKWDEAMAAFHDLLLDFPEDKPTHVLISRCQQYKECPPPDDWDCVYVMTSK